MNERPTPAAEHSPQGQRARLAQLLQQRIAKPKIAPLSFPQERLWFLHQLDPSQAAYHIHMAKRASGLLDIGAFRQSLAALIRRHETLRTTFDLVNGQLAQLIASASSAGTSGAFLALSFVDLQAVPDDARADLIQRIASDEVRRSFDLVHGPLLRVVLLRLDQAEHVLILTLHHIIADGWSIGVLIRELATLYQSSSTGIPAALAALPVQYADFVHWQRQWLHGDTETRRHGDTETEDDESASPHPQSPLQEQLGYWRRQLRGAPALLELPTDRPRPAVQTFRGARHRLHLSRDLSSEIQALGDAADVTLFVVLLAAFQTLLCRHTGVEDIVVGSPIANRNRAEIEGLIGCFVNTLVLRSDLSGNPQFRELLERVRKVAFDAYDHQDLPFEKLVEELQPARDMSYTPLFQVMLVLQNAPMPEIALPGLVLRPLVVERAAVQCDLALYLFEHVDGFYGYFEYSSDLFDAATIVRLADHFVRVLAGIVATPTQRLAALPLLSQAERQQLVEWNATQTGFGVGTRYILSVQEPGASRLTQGVCMS